MPLQSLPGRYASPVTRSHRKICTYGTHHTQCLAVIDQACVRHHNISKNFSFRIS